MSKQRRLIYGAVAVLGCALVSTTASSQSARISKRDALGCSDRETQTRIARIANSGDQEAFRKLAGSMILAGQCRIIKEGTALHLEDTAVWSGLACFRPAGQVSCLWASIDLTR